MDSELVTDSLPGIEGGGVNRRPLLRYTDRFREAFPFYLSIGMTEEQYWDGDCTLARDYRKAHELRLKRENEAMWRNGAYIYRIIADMAPLYRTFKPSKPRPYLDEPIDFWPDTSKEKEREAEKKKMEEQRARFRGMVERFNTSFLKKQKEKEMADGSSDGRTQLRD